MGEDSRTASRERSEERRVGKSVDLGGRRIIKKKTVDRLPPPVHLRDALRREHRPPVLFFQAEDGIRDLTVTGVQTCALPIYHGPPRDRRTHPRPANARRAGGARDRAVPPRAAGWERIPGRPQGRDRKSVV